MTRVPPPRCTPQEAQLSRLFFKVLENPKVTFLGFVIHSRAWTTYNPEPTGLQRGPKTWNHSRTFHVLARTVEDESPNRGIF